MADLRPERTHLNSERLDFRPERPDLGPERPDLKPRRSNSKPERPYGGGNKRTLDGPKKVPRVKQDFVPFEATAQKPSNYDRHEIMKRLDLRDYHLILLFLSIGPYAPQFVKMMTRKGSQSDRGVCYFS